MKPSQKNLTVIRISQSEAMLEAIKAGFFEAYLEKDKVVDLLSRNTCHGIRIELTKIDQDRLAFRAVTIGACKSIREAIVKTNPTASFENVNVTASIGGYTVEFQSRDLYALLTQPDCTGIRFFPGFYNGSQSSTQPTLVAVGVESNGFDIDKGAGYLRSLKINTSNIA